VDFLNQVLGSPDVRTEQDIIDRVMPTTVTWHNFEPRDELESIGPKKAKLVIRSRWQMQGQILARSWPGAASIHNRVGGEPSWV